MKKKTVFFHENVTLNIFCDSERKTSKVFANFPHKGVTTGLYVSRRYFWKKTSLREVKFLYLFMVLLRTLWLDGKLDGRQEGILRDQLKVSGKNFWEKPKFFEFCQISENFQFLGETVLAELSKLHSVCPEKHFEKKLLVLEKNMTLNPFSDIGWKTLTLGEILWEKWNFSRKKYDFESILWHWVKNFLFWPKISPGVSKLKCTCRKTVLNYFPEKINSIFLYRIYWEKVELHKNSGFARKAFFVSSGTIRGNIF